MTDKQKQCLLAYLGLYTGALDGIFGPQSLAAEERFRASYGISGEDLGAALLEAVAGALEPRDPWENIRWFQKEEFRCKCGGKDCGGFPAQVDPTLLALADRVREHFGSPATVSSGLRCVKHNARVGGAKASRHMSGKAMDFTVKGRSAAQVLAFVLDQPETRYAYAINGSFVHMDVM